MKESWKKYSHTFFCLWSWSIRLFSFYFVKKVKTSYFGTFEGYDERSKEHSVKWDDGSVNSFDVMGRWQEGMLPIVEWRLCEEKEIPTPAIKSSSAREKRAERKKKQDPADDDEGANVHNKPG